MDKDVVYLYRGILLGHKIEWHMPSEAKWVDMRDYHTNWSNSRKERKIPSITYVTQIWHKWSYLWNETDPDMEKRFVVTKGGARQERIGLEFGTNRCKLLYIKLHKQHDLII